MVNADGGPSSMDNRVPEYIDERRGIVETNLQTFIKDRYGDEELELIAYLAVGGKRLRGIASLLTCEAVGGDHKDALVAACAVELCQAASLAKDDVADGDTTRRGMPSFWKKFGLGMVLLVPDVIVPHAVMFTQAYGPRALATVVNAWAKLAQGQLRDSPRVFRAVDDDTYENLIGLKTAPLFEAAAELGIRASRKDHLITLGKQFGYNTGMAFQIYDDASDLRKAMGSRWDSLNGGKPLPVSLQALKHKVDAQDLITEADFDNTLLLAKGFLELAEQAAQAFPETDVQDVLVGFPQFCCESLLAEASS